MRWHKHNTDGTHARHGVHAWAVALLLATAWASSTAAAEAQVPSKTLRVLVLDTAAATDRDGARANLFAGRLASSLQSTLDDDVAAGKGPQGVDKVDVITSQEARTVLRHQASLKALGCEDEYCDLADVVLQLRADLLVTSSLAHVGTRVVATTSVLDARLGRALARGQVELPLDSKNNAAYDKGAADSARQLLHPDEARPTGASGLYDLRIGVLFAEYEVDEHGAEKHMRRLATESCLREQLQAKDAFVVEPGFLQALSGKTGPRQVVDNGMPDGVLGTEHIDVLMVGVVEHRADKKRFKLSSAKNAPQTIAVRSELTLKVIKMDTGEVLVSHDAMAKGNSPDDAVVARRSAQKRLCGKRLAELVQKLENVVVDRGARVSLDVEGTSPRAAQKLAKQLRTLPRVARAKLRQVKGGKARIDLTLKGGGAMHLVTQPSFNALVDVTEVTGDTLTAKVKG